MSVKTNLRSFRFSDEVACILESFSGKSLNDKFESLVLHCFWELPKREEELKKINALIDERNKTLSNLDKQIREINSMMNSLNQCKYSLENAATISKKIIDQKT